MSKMLCVLYSLLLLLLLLLFADCWVERSLEPIIEARSSPKSILNQKRRKRNAKRKNPSALRFLLFAKCNPKSFAGPSTRNQDRDFLLIPTPQRVPGAPGHPTSVRLLSPAIPIFHQFSTPRAKWSDSEDNLISAQTPARPRESRLFTFFFLLP